MGLLSPRAILRPCKAWCLVLADDQVFLTWSLRRPVALGLSESRGYHKALEGLLCMRWSGAIVFCLGPFWPSCKLPILVQSQSDVLEASER